MSNPQQPELRRSGHTPVEQDHAAEVAGGKSGTRERRRAAPRSVPPASEPGHHPEHEQDKPADPAHPPVATATEATATEPTGPYQWWKVAGPPHISLADRGITFATRTTGGLCIRFREAVPAALPTSALRHPAATVTVASPTSLSEALA
jgi:hypothetical protein